MNRLNNLDATNQVSIGDIPRGIGNCGVVAAATATGLPYEYVWNCIAEENRKPANWKGSTRLGEVLNFLHDVARKGVIDVKVRGGEYKRCTTINQFARRAPRDKIFIVWTTRHVQVVHGGEVVDQSYRGPVAGYWGRRKKINWRQGYTAIIEIIRPGQAAPKTTRQPSETPRPGLKGKNVGVGNFIQQLLVENHEQGHGWTTGKIVETVKQRFPASRTTGRDVAYHRCQLRKKGLLPPAA